MKTILLIGGGYRDYIDIDSLINWWFVEELCLNEESSRTKNCYLYKEVDGKIFVGPPWDFDAWTFGLSGRRKWYAKKTGLYYHQLFNDPYFVKRVKIKWKYYKPLWEAYIPLYIDELYSQIHRAAERNEKKWTNWHRVNAYGVKSYSEIVDDMKTAFLDQLEWMDLEINGL